MALLFSPAWQSKKPEKRLAALDKLPPEQAADIRADLALNDPDESVRLAATQAIQTPDALIRLLKQANNTIAPAIRQQLIQLLDNEQPLPRESRQRWLRNCDDVATLEHLARYATEAELRKTALQQANQQQLWHHCVQHDPLPANREFAVDRIENTQGLKQLIDALRKTDKHITKLLQQALEDKLLDAGDADTIQAVQLRCCKQLETLIEDKAEESALRAIDAQWAQVAGTDPVHHFPALAERYARSRRVFLRLHQPQELVVEAEPETTEPEIDPTLAEAQQIARKAKSWLNGKQLPRRKHIEVLRKQWRKLKAEFDDAKLSEQITEQLSQLNQRLIKQDEQWQQDLATSIAQIPKLQPLLDEGQLQAARELYQTLEEKLRQLKAIDNRSELRQAMEQLQAIKPVMQELGGWQHWSNNRKRRELCDRVEALIGKDIDPEALAEEIKKHQADWKALEASEKAEGSDKAKGGRDSPALWKRFQHLCRTAWEPCAEHFEQKRQNRALKREHIEKVMQDLLRFGDKAKKFDENAVSTTVRSGYRMLNELHRMPPKERRSLEKQLRAALAPFEEVNERQQKQAAYAKRQLIEKAQQLKPDDDLQNAIKQMKQLQADWKKTGRCDPKTDRSLWNDFRKQADRVFGVLDQQRKAHNQVRKEASSKLAGLVNEIGALAEQATADTLHELHKLSGQAESLESEADSRQLSSQLAAAKTKVEKAVKASANKARLSQLAELAKAAQARMPEEADDGLLKQARDAVINMEILAGKDSPAADKARRLELQVAQLAANLNGKGKGQSLLDQAEEWYQSATSTSKQWPALHKRVQALLK